MAYGLNKEQEDFFNNLGNDNYIKNLLDKGVKPSVNKENKNKLIQKEVISSLNSIIQLCTEVESSSKLAMESFVNKEEYAKAAVAKANNSNHKVFRVMLQNILNNKVPFIRSIATGEDIETNNYYKNIDDIL